MHVMIAVDGTQSAEHAASEAVAMFGHDHHYTLLSVGAPLPLQSVSPLGIQPALLLLASADLPDVRSSAERTVSDAASALEVDGVETITEIGPPGPTICDLAESRNVDVIVVGAHDRGWLSRLIEPSVAAYIVDHAPCHVVVARADHNVALNPATGA